MKILDITSKLPYPLIDGARICMYRGARGLASLGHDVHIVALEGEVTDPGPLAEFATVHTVSPSALPTPIGALLTLFNGRPYTQVKRDRKEAYALLDRLHAKERFDVVLADEIHIAQYGLYMKERHGLPYMLRSHNIEYEIYRRHTDTVKNPLMRAYLELQTGRWRRFEVEQMKHADVLAAITERDREAIERMAPGAIARTIPAAVDLDAFPYYPVDGRDEASMIMLGDMKWPPNRDAAIWFTREILPRVIEEVPNAVLHLIGDNAPLAQLPAPSANLRIEGRVPSVDPYFERATLGLIPLKVGGGMRVKMIEMMSSGMPIVSTTRGAEGNEATPGVHYLLADDTGTFADSIVRLLRDRAERKRLSETARAFVVEHYSVGEVSRKLEGLLLEALERTREAVSVR